MFGHALEVVRHLRDLFAHLFRRLIPAPSSAHPRDKTMLICGFLFAAATIITTIFITTPLNIEEGSWFWRPEEETSVKVIIDYTVPAREMPTSFRANKRMPTSKESHASGDISSAPFQAARDLIRIEDHRVWWESDNDKHDDEDDHLFHYSMHDPMKRLIHLVSSANATLKVQDAYRAEGIHHPKSLHKHGRAVDLTAAGMDLEQLARLTWAAGFDWVFFEAPKRGGAHIHASVTATNSPRYPDL